MRRRGASEKQLGDPRLSIEERYASKLDYLERVTRAAQELVAAGYLLAEDVQTVLEQASHRYDLLAGHVPAAQAVGG